MQYRYEDIMYNKRALTDNVILRVVGQDFSVVAEKDPAFVKMCWDMKAAEVTGQANSCPVTGRKEFTPVIEKLRDVYPGFRARYTQCAPVLCIDEASGITAQDASYMMANGSIALLARRFDEDAIETLLNAGIMPITTKEPIAVGTFLFIKNMRNDFKLNTSELSAFIMPEMGPTDVLGLPEFNPHEMDPFPAYRLKAVVNDE